MCQVSHDTLVLIDLRRSIVSVGREGVWHRRHPCPGLPSAVRPSLQGRVNEATHPSSKENVDSSTRSATLAGLSPLFCGGCRIAAAFGGPESQMVELRAVAGRIAVDREREADEPHSPVVRFGMDQPLRLDAGVELGPFQVAYQAYGTLD